MVFACQNDSFLQELKTHVVSCTPATLQLNDGNKKAPPTTGFEIICEDTVLFPEGGGQPSDRGWLNEYEVLHVSRRGGEAVIFTANPVDKGVEVTQKVDWRRRLDHMQQHSGQHLITALADSKFGFSTTSWWLGELTSFIELDTPNITSEQVSELEQIVNDKIRAALPVNVTVYKQGDPELAQAKTRGLPEDHVGEVRVVSITGLDNNMCCGTHVSNLSQLQAIKLLFAEKGKKGKSNLHFVSGGRVLTHLGACLDRERQMTTLLKNSPAEHVDLVDKTQKSLKIALKSVQTLLKDLALLEADKFKQIDPKPAYICIYRKEGDSEFARTFIRQLADDNVLKLLMWGEEKGEGQMQLQGPAELVALLGPQICDILKGKGMAKGQNFLAKVSALSQRNKAEALIKQHFEQKLNSQQDEA